VLHYALRRLTDQPVGFIASRRTNSSEREFAPLDLALRDGDRVSIAPLDVGALDLVLRLHLGSGFSRSVLLRLHAASGGVPLYALELARALLVQGDQVEPGGPLPVPATLRALIRDRLVDLPKSAADVILVVASTADPSLEIVRAVIGRAASKGVAAAVDAGVIETSGEAIRFAHPLYGSIAYAEARESTRRRIHARLAAVLAGTEMAAWHLVLSRRSPDAEAALIAEEAAAAARDRGAPETAAELAAMARRMTPAGSVDAARRALLEAQFLVEAGDREEASTLLHELLARAATEAEQAGILHRLALVEYLDERCSAAAELMTAALGKARIDMALRVELERNLAWALATLGMFGPALEHARAALAGAERLGDQELLGSVLTIDAVVEFVAGNGFDERVMERALSLRGPAPNAWIDIRPASMFGMVLKWADRASDARSLLAIEHRECSERGDPVSLSFVTLHLAELECWAGNLDRADALVDEGLATAAISGKRSMATLHSTMRGLVLAYRGRIDDARLALAGPPATDPQAEPPADPLVAAIRGLIALSLGDPAGADREMRPMADQFIGMGIAEPGVFRWVPDDIEALIGMGDIDRASRLLEPFENAARRLDRTSALATAARCRALLAAAAQDMPAAEAAAEYALVQHARLELPIEHGRTLLVKGQILRRARRWRDARDAIESSLATFENVGANQWAARARAELGRIGGRPRAPFELTPTEFEIAGLIASGKTVREVAASAFVSPKTVEANLSRVYSKLGFHSRAELGSWMETHRNDPAPDAEAPARFDVSSRRGADL
jgi:DNA-binding CsgD family transcriptional regulator